MTQRELEFDLSNQGNIGKPDGIIDKTIRSLEIALDKCPDNVKIMTSLAEIYLKRDILGPRTLQILERLSELTPENARIHRALSICYLIHQTTDLVQNISSLDEVQPQALVETMKRLDALRTQHSQSADLHKALGDIALFIGNPTDAVRYYQEAIHLGYEDRSHLLKALTLAQRAYDLPLSAVKFFARLCDELGLRDKAAGLYRKVVRDDISDNQSVSWLQAYLEETVAAEEELDLPPDHKLELMDLYINSEQIPRGLRIAHTLHFDELTDTRVVKKLGRVLIDLEDYRQAFDFLSRIPLDTENKALINEITLRLERIGELDTAVYLLQFINTHDLVIVEAKEREDREIKIHTELGLAELHMRNKKWDLALEKYVSIMKMEYDDWAAVLEKVDEILHQMERPPIATLIYLAEFLTEQGLYEKAGDYLSAAIVIYPGHIEAQQRLRLIFDHLISQSPQNAELHLRSGDLYLKMSQTERAISEYKEAASFPDFSGTANRRLAAAYAATGDYGMCLERYQSLPDISQDDFSFLFDLFARLEERGMLREATESLKLIHNVDPEYAGVETQIEEIENRMKEKGQSLFIDPKMRELIGDHAIGRYKYVSKIGSGGMGVVHKVFDLKNNCIVAMKILREGLSGSSKAIDRFFREARIAATLDHKNIVKIYDYNISNVYGQSYITMSFVDGESLRDIIERRFADTLEISTRDIAQSLFYLSQLCEALECTHKQGIVHRDIKPDNIMIDVGEVVKITDFGIVHIEEATFTPTGALIGTPRYMSPEQVRGIRIDGRSDIYSAGIIMYELLVGSPPFISGDIAYQQVNVEPTPPKDICPAIPEHVNRAIMKCLEKDPGNRYANASELKVIADIVLEEVGGYEPEQAPGAGSAPSARAPLLESELDITD